MAPQLTDDELMAYYRAEARKVAAAAPPMCEESRRALHALALTEARLVAVAEPDR